MLTIGLDQGPGNGMPQGTCLARLPTAVHVRLDVESAQSVRGGEGLLDMLHQ